jgi:hypothetical protein
VNFHDTYVWVDDNSHITVASRHQHWSAISVWVGIVKDQVLGPVVLPGWLTGTIMFCWTIYQYFWKMSLYISNSTCGHASWGITSVSLQCQTSYEPGFPWTADGKQRPSQLACTISWP